MLIPTVNILAQCSLKINESDANSDKVHKKVYFRTNFISIYKIICHKLKE